MSTNLETVSDWRDFFITRGPRMSAEAFLLKLGSLSAQEQRFALTGLPDTKSLTQRFENAWAQKEESLGGVPFLTKDLFFRAGHPTFAGSTFLPEEMGIPHTSSSLPSAFQKDAGAVECGHTQLNEFAYGLSGENPHYGDCQHPTHPDLLSGGSSSGSAWAVAKKIVPFALATDTAGSIRVPCGYCGVWGLRLSPDISPVGDIFPLSPGYDTQGWMTHNPKDLITVSKAVLGKSPKLGKGLWVGDLGLGMDSAILNTLRNFVRPLGVEEDKSATELLRINSNKAHQYFPVLGGTAAARVHAAWLNQRKNSYDPVVWERLNLASKHSAEEVREAEIYRLKITDTFRTLFKQYSFIALPCTFGPAVGKKDLTAQHRERLLALNAPATLAGLPALAAPVKLEGGLTVGVQFLFSDMTQFGWEELLTQLS